ILIGLLVYTVREPLRLDLLRTTDGRTSQLTIREVIRHLNLRRESVIGVSLGLSSQAMCNYAQQAWLPTFFSRVHGWSSSRTGMILGTMVIITGCLGMYLGGRLCDHWQRRSIKEAPLKVGVVSTISAGVFFCLAMILSQATWTLVLLVPAFFFLAMPVGSSYAALQLVSPNQLRGQVSALLMFTISIGGLTLGPFLVGFFDDYLFRDPNL